MASWMSIPMMRRMALPITQQTVSPTPTGRTPGFLSEAISPQAVNGARPCGSTRVVQIRLHVRVAAIATLFQSSNEAFLKEVHIQRHPCESTPDGPALPSVRRATEQIISPSSRSNNGGWGCCGGAGVFLHEQVDLVGVDCVVVD